MDERFKRVVQSIVEAEDGVCEELLETIAAFVQKTLDEGAAVGWNEYPEVVEHLKECSECRELAVDLLGMLWLDFLGLIEKPPEYPEFDFSFLKKG